MNKLMFVAPSAYRLGGVQTWLDYLLPGLAERGWEVVLGLVSGRVHDAEAYLGEHPFDRVALVDAGTGTRRGRVRSLARVLEAHRPDMVVVVNIADAYGAAARLRLADKGDFKIVATLHGLQPDFLQDFATHRDHIDAVICTNRLACEMVVECSKFDPRRVLYSPYGVEVPEVDASVESTEDGSLGDDGSLRIAYAGRLEGSQKRIHDLVEILRRGVASGLDLTLRIAGTGPEDDSFMAAVHRAHLTDRVEHMGCLDARSLREHVYTKSDVLLLTSSWETGPIVAWEAMAQGLAVVTSDYLGRKKEGSLEDMINCAVFPVGDCAAAVECLRRLQDPIVRRRIATSGRELVLRSYSRMRSIESWSDSLEAVVDLPPLPRSDWEPELPPAGRLDRLFGGEVADALRRMFGRRFVHSDPGGEWPHSYGDRRHDDPEFWRKAQEIDSFRSSPPAAVVATE